jgi:hypothetical protein
VNQAVAQLISAAVVGAVSPIATLATITVLSGRRGPLANTLCLLAGWTTVLVLQAILMRLILGDSGPAVSDQTKAVLNLIVGQLLLSFGLRNLIGARHPLAHVVEGTPEHAERPPKWMQALDTLTPAKAYAVGAILLLVSPADVAVYLSAIQGIAGADLSTDTRIVVNVGLIIAIDVCILAPLAVYIASPHRSQQLLSAGRAWLVANQRRLTAIVLLAFGALLIVSGAVHLLT